MAKVIHRIQSLDARKLLLDAFAEIRNKEVDEMSDSDVQMFLNHLAGRGDVTVLDSNLDYRVVSVPKG